MNKQKKKKPDVPTQAILTPDSRYPKTGIARPDESHVIQAKQYVDENHK